MAFTGRLGTDESQPGNLQPGAEGSWSDEGAFQSDAFQNDAFQVDVADYSFTADAWIAPYVRADACLLKTQEASFTADAVLLATQNASFSADAVLLVTVSASFTADAVLLVTQSASFSADAIKLRTGPWSDIYGNEISGASITADAVIVITAGASVSADAIVLATSDATVSADAIILATQSASFTADAVILATQSASFGADAELGLTVSASFTGDAVIFFEISEFSFSADAYIHLVVWFDDFNRADETPLGSPYYPILSSATDVNLASSTVAVLPSGFVQLRGYIQNEAFGVSQIDFYTGAQANNFAYLEIDNLGTQVDGLWYGAWFVGQYDSDSAAPNQQWLFYSDSALTDYEPVLLNNTWYTVKFIIIEETLEERLKVWKVGDPEPDWQITWPLLPIEGDFHPDATGWYMGGRVSDNFLVDNLLLTSAYEGVLRQQESFTANAVFFKTWVFEGLSSTLPSVFATSSANSGSSPMSISAPVGIALDDDVVVISVLQGQTTTASHFGTFRGTLGGPTFERIAAFASSNTTAVVFRGRVRPNLFGTLPSSWVHEWTAGTGVRLLFMIIYRDGRVRNVVRYGADLVAGTTVTIPAAYDEIGADGSLLLTVFAATAINTASFSPPINAVELRDIIRGSAGSSHVTAELNKTDGVLAGPNPDWTALIEGGGSSLSNGYWVEIAPIGGISADAVIRQTGNSVLAEALITKPQVLIWEDLFNDRFATNGWGGVWQRLDESADTGTLTADGAIARVATTGISQRRLSGYPVIGVGRYTFDFLFTAKTSFDQVIVEAQAANGYGMSVQITATTGVSVLGTTQPYSFVINQWYSATIDNFGQTTSVSVALRATPEVTTSVSGANAYSTSFTPRWWVRSNAAETWIDNVKVYTGDPWRRFYTLSANAIILKTMTQHPVGFGFLVDNTIRGEAEIARGVYANAVIISILATANFTANAVLVTSFTFHADAYLLEDMRARHERDGPDHAGVDYETVHTLAATIGAYLQGTNLRDVLIAIDERLTEIETQ